MGTIRTFRTLVPALLVALAFAPAPAGADHSACTGNNHLAGPIVLGSVTSSDPDWWVVHVTTVGAVVLQPLTGDADLAVFPTNCSGAICTSRQGDVIADVCTLGEGTFRVEVEYVTGNEEVIYALAVVSDVPDVAAQ